MSHEEELLSDQDLGISPKAPARRPVPRRMRYTQEQIERMSKVFGLIKILKITGTAVVLLFVLLGAYFLVAKWYAYGGFGLILMALGIAVYFVVFRRFIKAFERTIPPDLYELLKRGKHVAMQASYIITGFLLKGVTAEDVWNYAMNFIWILLLVTVILLALIWLLSGSVLTQLGISYVANIKQILITTVMALIMVMLIVWWLNPDDPFLVNTLNGAIRTLIESGFGWAGSYPPVTPPKTT